MMKFREGTDGAHMSLHSEYIYYRPFLHVIFSCKLGKITGKSRFQRKATCVSFIAVTVL